MLKKIAFVVCALMLPVAAWAGHFKGHVEAGYQASSGNSDTSALNAKASVTYTQGNWTDSLKGSANSASQSGASTAERYTAQGKSEYSFTKNNYVYGQLDYLKDLFGSIRERTSETLGYGRRLLNTPVQTLDAEVGAGLSQSQEQKPSLARHNDVIGQVGLDYQYNITKTSQFEQTVTVQSGSANTFMESETSLRLAIVKNLFAKLSYTVDHNTTTVDNLAKTDTYTAISLSYEFGQKD